MIFKKSSKVIFFVLAILFALNLVAMGSIGTSTLGVDVNVASGESVTGSFLVVNGDETPTDVRILLADFDRQESGSVVILPPQASPDSLANYITFSPADFTLPAGKGQSQQVTFTINLPAGVDGPHWSMLLVQEIEEVEEPESDETDDEGGRRIEPRIGIQLGIQIRQVDASSVINDGRITDIEVVSSIDGMPLGVIAQFENSGTTFQRPSGEVRIINSAGDVVSTTDIAPFRTLPNSTRSLEIPIESSLPPGEYVALVIIDFGGDFMLAGQVRFVVF